MQDLSNRYASSRFFNIPTQNQRGEMRNQRRNIVLKQLQLQLQQREQQQQQHQ